MKISIVTSLYKSEGFVEEFYQRHLACIAKLGLDYEFVFVNDHSPDSSAEKVRQLIQRDQNVGLVDFSRNFGQHAGMYAGMYYSSGDLVLALDCDLEESPENLLEMYRLMSEHKGTDVVYGVTEERQGNFFRNQMGAVFYKILNSLSEVQVPKNQTWQRLMTKQYVEALLKYTETESLPAGLMALAGFKQLPMVVEKTYKGSSTYSAKKRFLLALNSVLSFSSKPLVFICLFGFSIISMVLIISIAIILLKILGYNFLTGWLSLFLSIWLVGGLNLFSVGVVGLYLAKVFNQVKARPKFIVRSCEGRLNALREAR